MSGTSSGPGIREEFDQILGAHPELADLRTTPVDKVMVDPDPPSPPSSQHIGKVFAIIGAALLLFAGLAVGGIIAAGHIGTSPKTPHTVVGGTTGTTITVGGTTGTTTTVGGTSLAPAHHTAPAQSTGQRTATVPFTGPANSTGRAPANQPATKPQTQTNTQTQTQTQTKTGTTSGSGSGTTATGSGSSSTGGGGTGTSSSGSGSTPDTASGSNGGGSVSNTDPQDPNQGQNGTCPPGQTPDGSGGCW